MIKFLVVFKNFCLSASVCTDIAVRISDLSISRAEADKENNPFASNGIRKMELKLGSQKTIQQFYSSTSSSSKISFGNSDACADKRNSDSRKRRQFEPSPAKSNDFSELFNAVEEGADEDGEKSVVKKLFTELLN